ncbi:MAG: phosphodiester glycosidase family protein [Lachnospiraceae bacterium]|nr:phosphodiester glycosidase family protein [Lachnospiraceae bacterium]
MKILKRTLLILLTVVLLLLIAIFGAMTVLCKGPSKAAANRFVNTVMETSALKFIPSIYFSQEKIDEMLVSGKARTPSAQTDVNLINIPKKKAENTENNSAPATEDASSEEGEVSQNTAEAASDGGQTDENTTEGSKDGILIEELRSETYRGRMMIVEDPSRVYIRMLSGFSETGAGKKVIDMANEDGAVAAMNAGGFYDPDGHGKGGMPLGAVIKDGVLVSNHPADYHTIIGFDAEHRLIVGDMSPQAAIDAGMMNGIAFGPALVINGERVPTGSGGGVNPRSAIGQRGDGAVLLLSIDGRQPTSLGATASELEDIMLEYGAVNAANLDGGSSSVLYYEGELISSPSSVVGIRPVPTAILVK